MTTGRDQETLETAFLALRVIYAKLVGVEVCVKEGVPVFIMPLLESA